MRNIEIGRYGADEAKDLRTGKGFSGWISGEGNDGRGWILWLDETGRPVVYFGNREHRGAVAGEPVHLIDPAPESCGTRCGWLQALPRGVDNTPPRWRPGWNSRRGPPILPARLHGTSTCGSQSSRPDPRGSAPAGKPFPRAARASPTTHHGVLAMTELALRAFHVSYETITNLTDGLAIEHKMVDAAYYQQGFGHEAKAYDGDGFVVFKDADHKPVFTVRASSVVSIEEIRGDQPQQYTISVGPSVMSDAEITEFCDNMTRRFRQQYAQRNSATGFGDSGVAAA